MALRVEEKRLTPEREQLVIEHADDAARLAMWMNRSYPALELDELEGTAHLALVKAAIRFDPKRGTAFWTYAQDRVAGALRDEKRAHRRAMGLAPRPSYKEILAGKGAGGDQEPDVLPTSSRPKELEDYVDPATSMGTRFGREQQRAAVRQIYDQLSPEDQAIAKLRLMEERPMRECSEQLGVSPPTIMRREKRLRRMLIPILSRRLGRNKQDKA